MSETSDAWLSEVFEDYAKRVSAAYHEAAVFWMERSEAAEREAEQLRNGATMGLTTTHPREQMRNLILEAIEEWMAKRLDTPSAPFPWPTPGDLADEILEGIAWTVESD